MKSKKVCLISLGCAKNLVDSEMMLGSIARLDKGFEITPFKDKADLIIINTCGFIEDAKKEAIDTILEVVDNKKDNQKVVVTGCLVQRYKDDLIKEIPEVDLYLDFKEYYKFGFNINNLFNNIFNKSNCYGLDHHYKVLSTKPFTSYIRISDGCDNKCSYCAIPLIRGANISRTIDDVFNECIERANDGVKEIVLIAQDTTRFGKDNNERIEDLLIKLDNDERIENIRLLYLYPDEISDELIDIISNSKKICHYFDIPIQHASNKILKLMNRRGSKEHILSIINKIRNKCDDAILRTTVMVGFPGENDDDFNELVQFIKLVKFDRLGAFKYSKEEDTKAFDMEQVDENVKETRFNKLMEVQEEIAKSLSLDKIGKIYDCYVENIDYQNNMYEVRSYGFSGDDVDGYIYVKSDTKLNEGDKIKVKITNSFTYDLEGEIIK